MSKTQPRVVIQAISVTRLNPNGPPPPLYMPPWRGKIAEGELNDLVAYLMNLLPKSEKESF